MFRPDKDQLYNIREQLSKKQKSIEKMADEKSFKTLFSEIRGEQNKIVKDFKEEAQKFNLIMNKQFYWYTEMRPEIILDKNLIDTIEKAYLAQKPLMDFFAKAL